MAASALRLSFQTDRPLFPYREPDSKRSAEALGAHKRLLRIYFLAEARYQGELTKDIAWTGQVAWANKLSPEDRKRVLELLQLPQTTGPADWWLTEFEDDWPYRVAPADVYFARAAEQNPVKRPAIVEYTAAPLPTDITAYAIAAVLLLPPLLRRFHRPRSGKRARSLECAVIDDAEQQAVADSAGAISLPSTCPGACNACNATYAMQRNATMPRNATKRQPGL